MAKYGYISFIFPPLLCLSLLPLVITSAEVRTGYFRIKPATRITDNLVSETSEKSFMNCARRCVQRTDCASYNYHETDQKCELTSKMADIEDLLLYSANSVWTAGVVGDCTKKRPYPENPCNANPCLNGATCTPIDCNRGFECDCTGGWEGVHCDQVSGKDCAELYQNGLRTDGVYTVYPEDGGPSIQVVCDMTTAGGGWSIFQRRLDGSVHFNTTIEKYRNGFGNLNGEFWLGNNNLHRLTSQVDQELYIYMECFNGSTGWALYDLFRVADQSNWYNLTLGLYSNGTVDDSFSFHNHAPFTNHDSTYPGAAFPCSLYYPGGWWYPVIPGGCLTANLNAFYWPAPGTHDDVGKGMNWEMFTGYKYSLKTTKMMFRPAGFS